MLKYIIVILMLATFANASIMEGMISHCNNDDSFKGCHRFVATIYGHEFSMLEVQGCERLPCAAAAVACTATCLYEFPLCTVPVTCTQCIKALYKKCCHCVLPKNICGLEEPS